MSPPPPPCGTPLLTCGPPSLWTCGPPSLWTCGSPSLWTCGPQVRSERSHRRSSEPLGRAARSRGASHPLPLVHAGGALDGQIMSQANSMNKDARQEALRVLEVGARARSTKNTQVPAQRAQWDKRYVMRHHFFFFKKTNHGLAGDGALDCQRARPTDAEWPPPRGRRDRSGRASRQRKWRHSGAFFHTATLQQALVTSFPHLSFSDPCDNPLSLLAFWFAPRSFLFRSSHVRRWRTFW
jgi:hypothetical protein